MKGAASLLYMQRTRHQVSQDARFMVAVNVFLLSFLVGSFR